MDEDGYGDLGFYVLAVLNIFMCIGAILSTAAINKFGTKLCLVFGGIGNSLWIFLSLLPVGKDEGFSKLQGLGNGAIYTIMIIAAIINGLAMGDLWASAN